MQFESLEVGIENADFYLTQLLPVAFSGRPSWRELQGLCASFRQRAACQLLLNGDVDSYSIGLMQSASAFAELLPACDGSSKRTSEADPLFDAIAGHHWDCAGQIARHSRTEWNRDYEYEEEFLYVRGLVAIGIHGDDEASCRALVDAHERASEGGDHEERDVLIALHERDSDGFDGALLALLDKRAASLEFKIEHDLIPIEVMAWRRAFSTEGLALVHIAKRLGLATATAYPLIPTLARRALARPFLPDSWRRVQAPQ